jgi:Bladder cancer-related protein BC10
MHVLLKVILLAALVFRNLFHFSYFADCLCRSSSCVSANIIRGKVRRERFVASSMYCLQWLIPVLLLPKPVSLKFQLFTGINVVREFYFCAFPYF